MHVQQLTLARCAQRRRPRGFQDVQVVGGRGRGDFGDRRSGIRHDDVLVAGAARAVVPSGHVDAAGRRAQTPVSAGRALVHVQLAGRPLERVRARAHAGARAHAAVQTFLLAHGYTRRQTRNTALFIL